MLLSDFAGIIINIRDRVEGDRKIVRDVTRVHAETVLKICRKQGFFAVQQKMVTGNFLFLQSLG